MRNYYFLAASLPPIEVGKPADITFEELMNRFAVNLAKSDLEKTVLLRRYVDLNNIRALLLEEPIDPRGNLSEKELDEAILTKSELPDYVFDFLDSYETATERVRNFSGLMATFFAEEVNRQTGFVKRYLTFERESRLVLLALRAKELHRDIMHELQFEDFTDPLVAQIIAQKDSDTYEPPQEYMDLKALVQSCGPDPWERHKAFAKYRFNKIDELVDGRHTFTIERILAYMAQLMIVEDWNELDAARGKQILETFKKSSS